MRPRPPCFTGAIIKCPTNHRHQPHRINYENFVKLWRTTESTTGLQSDPPGQVIDLSKNRFTKNFFKLINKNLDFVPTDKFQ